MDSQALQPQEVKVSFFVLWLDWIVVCGLLAASLAAYFYGFSVNEDVTSMTALFFFTLSPFILVGLKYALASTSLSILRKRFRLDPNLPIVVEIPNSIKGQANFSMHTKISLPHCYFEYRGGDTALALSVRKYAERYAVPLSGIFQELTGIRLYAPKRNQIEVMSLFSPEVLEHIVRTNVPCSIETRGNSIVVSAGPDMVLQDARYHALIGLCISLKTEIEENQDTFKKPDVEFDSMREERRFFGKGKRKLRIPKRFMLAVAATVIFAALTLVYASEAGSGSFSPVLDVPDSIGLLIIGLLLTSPYLGIAAVLSLGSATANVRPPAKPWRFVGLPMSRSLIYYGLVLLICFVLLLLSATPE